MLATPTSYSSANACGIAFRDFALLSDVKGGGTTEFLALLASLGDAGLRSGQLALKLGNARHDRDDQFADVGGGVAPGLTEADEAAGAVLELTEDISVGRGWSAPGGPASLRQRYRQD
jgi:hypothetical protein